MPINAIYISCSYGKVFFKDSQKTVTQFKLRPKFSGSVIYLGLEGRSLDINGFGMCVCVC